jgi:hypothetical protein
MRFMALSENWESFRITYPTTFLRSCLFTFQHGLRRFFPHTSHPAHPVMKQARWVHNVLWLDIGSKHPVPNFPFSSSQGHGCRGRLSPRFWLARNSSPASYRTFSRWLRQESLCTTGKENHHRFLWELTLPNEVAEMNFEDLIGL